MEIIHLHDNGQVLRAYKSYDELTKQERDALVIPSNRKIEDFEYIRIDYNKKGRVAYIRAEGLVEEISEKNAEGSRAFNELLRAVNNKKVNPKMAWSAFLNNK